MVHTKTPRIVKGFPGGARRSLRVNQEAIRIRQNLHGAPAL